MSEAVRIDLDSLRAVECDLCGFLVDPNAEPPECSSVAHGRCSP